jgi:hypothetical protein
MIHDHFAQTVDSCLRIDCDVGGNPGGGGTITLRAEALRP